MCICTYLCMYVCTYLWTWLSRYDCKFLAIKFTTGTVTSANYEIWYYIHTYVYKQLLFYICTYMPFIIYTYKYVQQMHRHMYVHKVTWPCLIWTFWPRDYVYKGSVRFSIFVKKQYESHFNTAFMICSTSKNHLH